MERKAAVHRVWPTREANGVMDGRGSVPSTADWIKRLTELAAANSEVIFQRNQPSLF